MEAYFEPWEKERPGLSISVNDSENMDKDFTIRQRSTRPKKQPIELNKTGAMSKDIRTFFNKERNVLARNCIEKKIIVID